MSTIPLIAAQHTRVGTVTVSHDTANLYIRYQIDVMPGRLLNDFHAHVAVSYERNGIDGGIPHNRGGMIPGQFAHHFNANGVIDHTFTVPIQESFREVGTVWCAAHATVGDSLRAKSVVSAKQGPKRNGKPVAADRSDPRNALNPNCPATWRPGEPVTFFTMGVDGHLTVDFGQALDVVQHPRITCWEITQGPHMTEKVKVEVSMDLNGPWTLLSPEATNGRPGSTNLITVTSIGVTGVQRYRYARVTDTSGMVVNPSIGEPCYEDGFDLEGICAALPGRETAWALSGEQPLETASWGQPFSYELE